MRRFFNRLGRLAQAYYYEHIKDRSSEQSEGRWIFLQTHDYCEACGSEDWLFVHAIKPGIHLGQRWRQDNLIALCMTKKECLFRIGCGGDFHAYNPNVLIDAKLARVNPSVRSVIEEKAKNHRLYEDPLA